MPTPPSDPLSYMYPWTPIFRLPELLSQIFIYTLPQVHSTGSDTHYYTSRPSSRSPPVLLALVCKHWRNVAYATPQLWSSIDLTSGFPFRASGDEIAQRQREVLQRWIRRSGTVPLDVHTWSGGGTVDVEQVVFSPLIRAHIRWRDLTITACFDTIKTILESMAHSPRLERVKLTSTTPYTGETPDPHQLELSLHNARRLRRLDLEGGHTIRLDSALLPPSLQELRIAYSSLSITPPPPQHQQRLTSIRHLHLVRISIKSPLTLLSLLSNSLNQILDLRLEIVNASGLRDTVSQILNGPMVSLPHLRTMQYKTNFFDHVVGIAPGDDLNNDFPQLQGVGVGVDVHDVNMTLEAAFLSRFHLPSLTSLCFSIFTEDLLTHLTHLLKHSQPPLSYLRLQGFIPNSFNPHTFFAQLPHLTHLRISNATHDESVTCGVLRALTVHSRLRSRTRSHLDANVHKSKNSNANTNAHIRINLGFEDDSDIVTPECANDSEWSEPICPRLSIFEYDVWASRITPNYVTDMILSRARVVHAAHSHSHTRGHPSSSSSSEAKVTDRSSDASGAGGGADTVVPLRRFALSLLPSNAYAVLSHPEIVDCTRDGLDLQCFAR